MTHIYNLEQVQTIQVAIMNAKVSIANDQRAKALDYLKEAEYTLGQYRFESKYQETITQLLGKIDKLEQEIDDINQWL